MEVSQMNNKPWLNSYDEGVAESIEYPKIPLQTLLTQAAEKNPEAPCTIFNGATISFAEMETTTDRLAAGFASIGIKRGDRVGVFIPNTPQFVIAYFALVKLGAVVVAINPLYTKPEIIHQVNDAGAEIIILMTNNYEKIKSIQDQTGLKQIVVTNLKEALPPILQVLFGLFKEKKLGFRANVRENDVWMKDLITNHRPEDKPDVIITDQDTALLQYSGGTTGLSKGVVASHANLIANTYQIREWNTQGLEGKEVVLMAIPLYHAYGMVVGMLYGISMGAALVMVPDPRDIPNVLKNIQKYGTTIFPGVPALYSAINNNAQVREGKYDLSSIKFCISGSAPLHAATKGNFEKITGGALVEGYGLSEAPVATHCNPILGVDKIGSIGIPFPDIDCKVMDLETGTKELGVGEVGELIIKGPQVMKGYHNMPKETKIAIRDGWLFTGDVVHMDEDGYFFIVGRSKNLIKCGGFQVWPTEVEAIIRGHEKILEVAIAGVPDAENNEAVKAWVITHDGSEITRAEIKIWCKDKLAAYKIPSMVECCDELPRTSVGKVLYRKLVETHIENKKEALHD
jgi:long-chain acyl-CoA synthetase